MLQSINIRLAHNRFGVVGIDTLMDMIISLSNLTDITIGFDFINSTHQPHITECLQKKLGQLARLQKLSLSLMGNELSNEGLALLSEGISKLVGLNELTLVLTDNLISDTGVEHLARALSSLNHLKNLSLVLHSNIISNRLVASALCGCQSIPCLTLRCGI